jgi:hypothetical protein
MRQDASHPSPPRTARWRSLLSAVAVAAALGASVALAGIAQHQVRPAQKAGVHPASAPTVSLTSLSVPVSVTVGVAPATVLNPATRGEAIGLVIGRLNRQLAVRHLQERRVGLVQVFASGSIAGIPRSQRAARFVLNGLRLRDLMFANAVGQGFWTGGCDCFAFQIYFLT